MKLLLLVGLTRRTGTNLLRDLLSLHPEITVARDVSEDCLLAPSEHLRHYEEWVTGVWANWTPDERLRHYRAQLYEGFGEAVERVLLSQPTEDGAAYLATKSPAAKNLRLLPKLLPGRPLVVVTRDGRSTVESMVRSFQTPFKEAVEFWRNGAAELIQLREEYEEGKDFLVVRFEDLQNRREQTLDEVLGLIGRSVDRIAEEAANLPVRGSCEEVESGGKVEWKTVVKDASFNPVERHAGWTRRQHKQFAKLAGREQGALGYDL